MKRILFIVPTLSVGGMERLQVTLANKLASSGYDVTIMLLEPIYTLKADLLPEVHVVYKPPYVHPGTKIPYIRHKFYDDGMWEKRATPKRLYKYYVGKEEFDVEIAFFRGLPIKILAGSPRREKNFTTISKKSVGTHLEDMKNTDFDSEFVGRRSLAWVHNDFERATGYLNSFKNVKEVFDAYSNYDYVVCVSEQAAEGFKKTIGDTGNITTVYNMLPVQRIRELANEDSQLHIRRSKLHLVIVARLLDSAKGQVRLINAVSRLHEERADLSLAIVGGGVDYQLLDSLICEKNAGSYIELVGEQKNPYPFIKKADLLICASYFEGYNLTVAEALILGTPVLSTDCTGPNEILDHGKYGMIVENSEDGLYNGLKLFVDKPSLLQEYKEKTVQRQDFFDEVKILKQIAELF